MINMNPIMKITHHSIIHQPEKCKINELSTNPKSAKSLHYPPTQKRQDPSWVRRRTDGRINNPPTRKVQSHCIIHQPKKGKIQDGCGAAQGRLDTF